MGYGGPGPRGIPLRPVGQVLTIQPQERLPLQRTIPETAVSVSPYTVSDVMTRTAVAIGSRASYKKIVELMSEWKVSAVPVLAGDGRVVGVVSKPICC